MRREVGRRFTSIDITLGRYPVSRRRLLYHEVSYYVGISEYLCTVQYLTLAGKRPRPMQSLKRDMNVVLSSSD